MSPQVSSRAEHDTGRLRGALPDRVRSIVFGDTVDDALDRDMPMMARIDQAHLVMLVEQGIVDRHAAGLLVRTIRDAEHEGFSSLRGRSAARGLYLLYEHWLAETVGEDVAGRLHTARSRNDLGATLTLLRLRGPLIAGILAVVRLIAAYERKGRRHLATVMPIHTHYQPAQPVTVGHYCAAASSALLRDAEAILRCLGDIQVSPLGAGAIAGTGFPIDPERTAALLGFDRGPLNAIDAIASRDCALRLLSALAVHGVLLSRLAHDLQLWTTQEFGTWRLPDDLVGSSSMMPQKRNAYLLEHVKGKSTAAASALTAAMTAMHATPFSNSIAVNAEALRPMWSALDQMRNAATLLRVMVEAAEPLEEAALASARGGQTTATALADILVREQGLAFRLAHHEVGRLCRDADPDDPGGRLPDPSDTVEQARYGGGPAPKPTAIQLSRVRASLHLQIGTLRDTRAGWRAAAEALDGAAASLASTS